MKCLLASIAASDRPALILLAAALLVIPCIPTAALAQDADFVPGRVIVKYRSNAPVNRGAQLHAAVGALVVKRLGIINAEVLAIPDGWEVDEAVEWYRGQVGVEYAEPDYLVYAIEGFTSSPNKSLTRPLKTSQVFAKTPDDTMYPQMWALNNTGQSGGLADADIDAPEAWDITTGNDTIIVAVIDTGIDTSHPDLAANIWVNPGEIAGDSIDNDGNGFIDDIHGWDFANDDASVYDDADKDYHGTHVAGTIGAVSNNAEGVTGIAWNVQIMSAKFLHGGGSTSDAIDALQYAVDNGAHMTTNSWGGGGPSAAMQAAIEASGDAGLLFMAASGNAATDIDAGSFYPAGYPSENIISVNSTDHNDALSSFSNYGLTKTDLGAPGSNILSTYPDGNYNSISGTSMATPHVTGAAVLVYSVFPNLTHQEVKNRLMMSGDALAALEGKSVSGRRLNVYNALDNDSIPPNAVADLAVGPDAEQGTGYGEVTPFAGTALTLVWTAPGDDGAVGTSNGYDLRYATTPITSDADFGSAMRAEGEPTAQPSGTTQSVTITGLDPESAYYFSLKSIDNVGNQSELSNSPTGETGKITVFWSDGAETIASEELWNINLPWARTDASSSPEDATAPLGGAWSWTDSPGDNYGSDMDVSLESLPIDLSSIKNPVLSFDHRYWLESGYDFGYVEAYSGGDWVEVKMYTGYQTDWTSVSVDLKDFADEDSFRFRFRLISDETVVSDGWYVDDVRVFGDRESYLAVDVVLDASGDTALVTLSLDTEKVVTGLSYRLSWGSAANLTGDNPLSFYASTVTDRLQDSGLTYSVEVNTETDMVTGILLDTSGDGSIAPGEGPIIEFKFPLTDDLSTTDLAFVRVTPTGSPNSGLLPTIDFAIPFNLLEGALADSVGNSLVLALGQGGTLEIGNVLNADVDMSGAVDVADVVSMIDFYLGRVDATPLQFVVADTYGDELLNVVDIVRGINIVLGRPIGTATFPTSASLVAAGQKQRGRAPLRGLDVALQSGTGVGTTLVADIPDGVVGLQLSIQHGPSHVSDARLLLEDNGFQFVKHIGSTSSSFMIYSADNSPFPAGTQPVLELELESTTGSGVDASGSNFYLSEVLGVDASGFPVYPNVAPMLAVEELLGNPKLLPSQRLQLDRRGNADGVYNLGDVLSLIHRAGLFPGVAR